MENYPQKDGYTTVPMCTLVPDDELLDFYKLFGEGRLSLLWCLDGKQLDKNLSGYKWAKVDKPYLFNEKGELVEDHPCMHKTNIEGFIRALKAVCDKYKVDAHIPNIYLDAVNGKITIVPEFVITDFCLNESIADALIEWSDE